MRERGKDNEKEGERERERDRGRAEMAKLKILRNSCFIKMIHC